MPANVYCTHCPWPGHRGSTQIHNITKTSKKRVKIIKIHLNCAQVLKISRMIYLEMLKMPLKYVFMAKQKEPF